MGSATGYKLCMLIKELHEGSFSESIEKSSVITSCDNIQGLKYLVAIDGIEYLRDLGHYLSSVLS